jgi:GalNAc-alpha-(1->4)-GalNAc-alpha-(1->3)-diNAcBac-PP-undecaprenol alpha-1,4-N-acetyl-D-galactosaminyltransferase
MVVSSMRGGGAERVIAHMGNYWAQKGWPVTVLTIFHGCEAPSYELDRRVVHHDVAFARKARHPVPDVRALRALKGTFDGCSPPERCTLLRDLDVIVAVREAIQRTRPEIVISFIDATNVRVLLAVEGLGIPVIVSERSDPWRNVLGEGMRRLRRRLYPKAAFVVSQTEEMAAFFAPHMGARSRVIHNPVVRHAPSPLRPSSVAASSSSANGASCSPEEPNASAVAGWGSVKPPGAEHVLVAMGRLVEEKGFSLLIRAFAAIAAKHPTWSLEIWGIGPQRHALERLALRLVVSGRVRLKGFTRRPAEVLERSDLFALSSLSEGFPNALCEAMVAGLPVVSFDCSSGVRQIIRHGVDGVIVPTIRVAALAEALDRLMSSRDERARLAGRAVEAADRFAIEKAMAQWEALAHASVRRVREGMGDGAVRRTAAAPVV